MPGFILATNCFTRKHLHKQWFSVTQQVFRVVSRYSNEPNVSKYEALGDKQVRHILLVLEQSLIPKNAAYSLLVLNTFNIFS